MPTVLRQDGFRVMIFVDDHEPPHAHCFKADGVIVIELDPIRVRKNDGLKTHDIRRALRLIEQHQQMLLNTWRRFHS